MSRVPKNNINTPFLHIMIQGNNKSFIFENTKDKEKYNISYRVTSKVLGISREKLRMIMKRIN